MMQNVKWRPAFALNATNFKCCHHKAKKCESVLNMHSNYNNHSCAYSMFFCVVYYRTHFVGYCCSRVLGLFNLIGYLITLRDNKVQKIY